MIFRLTFTDCLCRTDATKSILKSEKFLGLTEQGEGRRGVIETMLLYFNNVTFVNFPKLKVFNST